eukprot:CAMPEP_0202862280 /NCGR_PEP_ID=MMETSP1391-20130828/3379_1 /ASSEMBLY_ACC=CAM_ASM_000867 /TAXON_ID=1034604 /ORGANISM="Chlamydomonas leiostraca, Strain SAG 11-49" /LENGTH=101 /DNA_ID=CAMNT_0049541795 /DNA_START=185 /DNA_END=490 /DNA_ORIENTATION=+
MSIPTQMDPIPAVATLLPSSANSESSSVAQRIALKMQRPVLCSWNIPGTSPMLEAIAERRLLQELRDMFGTQQQQVQEQTGQAAHAEGLAGAQPATQAANS